MNEKNKYMLDKLLFLDSILESSTEYSIIAKDLDANIVAWNEGAKRIYGYEAEEIVGKSAFILHEKSDVDSGFAKKILDEVEAKGAWSGRLRRVRKNGSTFIASATITLRKDKAGNALGFTQISHEITQQIKLEEELKEKNIQLENSNRRIQEANRLKSEFLANMSHELRTPLNAIIGFAELMHAGKIGPLSKEHKEYLGDILTSSQHLLQLINDVLDLAKVESGRMQFFPEVVDLNRVISEVREILHSLIYQKHIEFSQDIPKALSKVFIDPSKLKQVLYNYLSNAIKFSNEGGKIEVSVQAERDGFRINVKDTGIGIAKEDFNKLFVEFQQIDSTISKKYQGTGLGLVLSKRIIEAQGGRVGVESELGRGSTFFAIIPRIDKNNKQSSHQILILEGAVSEQKEVEQTINNAGYKTVCCGTAFDALEIIDNEKLDLIILDALLPDLSGWSVLHQIRTSKLNSHIPVIVLSVEKEELSYFKPLVSDILIKPIKPELLLKAIKRTGIEAVTPPLRKEIE